MSDPIADLARASRRGALVSALGLIMVAAAVVFGIIRFRGLHDEVAETRMMLSVTQVMSGVWAKLDAQNSLNMKEEEEDHRGKLDTLHEEIEILEAKAAAAEAREARSRATGARRDLAKLYTEGQRLRSQGKLTEARQSFEQAAAADPGWAPAHVALGELEAAAGTPAGLQKARLQLKQAIEIDKDDVSAVLRLSRIEQKLGNVEEAEKLAKRALQMKPGSPTANAILKVPPDPR